MYMLINGIDVNQWNRSSRNKPTQLQPLDFQQRPPKHTLVKRQPLQQTGLGKMDIHM
jgi:hypothetical protein